MSVDPVPHNLYTLSLHDALPIWTDLDAVSVQPGDQRRIHRVGRAERTEQERPAISRAAVAPHRFDTRHIRLDRKSTRLNSSHANISYAVFCLKKKTKELRLAVSS